MSNSYVVIELQTNEDGTVGNLVWSFDNRPQAEQQYHTVLAAAAVSTLPKHAAIMMDNSGLPILRQCYDRTSGSVEPYYGG